MRLCWRRTSGECLLPHLISSRLLSFGSLSLAYHIVRSFLRIGIYLVLEQLKVLVYRNLFKKVYLLTEKNSRVNILLLETVLRALGADCDADEVECVLSNLIYQSKIKGYISHQKRYLIVSKAEPFPSGAVLKKGT